MRELIWHDGQIFPPEDARCSCLDRGRLYGDGLFETMRTYQGKIFRLETHLQRLAGAAQRIHLALPMTADDLQTAVQKTLKESELASAYIRLTVTRGVGGSPSQLDASTPSVTIWVRPFSGYPPELYKEGMSAVLAEARRNEHSLLSTLKTLNYLDNLLSRAEAQRAGADEAILLNTFGQLAEAAASNLFIVEGGCVLTPPIEAGVLPGITRACVLELCRDEGISIQEQPLELHQLPAAEEAFLTNSLMEIMPLTSFAGKAIGSGQPGEVTRQLQQAYRDLADEETKA
ncbi:MAG: aminotransferase class IV [Armatimonadetes bacterium]|nr:aminotransferase class IV [Armatimonadota bacterium]